MQEIPKQIDKKLMYQMYCNQFSYKFMKEEIQSIQEKLGINIRNKILSEQVKMEFFLRHGLPNGYTINNL